MKSSCSKILPASLNLGNIRVYVGAAPRIFQRSQLAGQRSLGVISACVGSPRLRIRLSAGANFARSSRVPPCKVVDGWAYIAVGQYRGCGIGRKSWRMHCWGWNRYGLGFTKVPKVHAKDIWFSVNVGYAHSCGMTESNRALICWGSNKRGESKVPKVHGGWFVVSCGNVLHMWYQALGLCTCMFRHKRIWRIRCPSAKMRTKEQGKAVLAWPSNPPWPVLTFDDKCVSKAIGQSATCQAQTSRAMIEKVVWS